MFYSNLNDQHKIGPSGAGMVGLPGPPAALLASQDLVTAGAVKAPRRPGSQDRTVPAGFDDIPLAGILTPAITVITQDAAQSGCPAARLLPARLDGDDPPPRIQVGHTGRIARGPGEIRPAPAVAASR
jgi:LacI family transcriptional regulator, galactose operon repressor